MNSPKKWEATAKLDMYWDDGKLLAKRGKTYTVESWDGRRLIVTTENDHRFHSFTTEGSGIPHGYDIVEVNVEPEKWTRTMKREHPTDESVNLQVGQAYPTNVRLGIPCGFAWLVPAEQDRLIALLTEARAVTARNEGEK